MTDDQLRPVASHAPEPIIVEIEGIGELEFPGDTDSSVIQAKVRELTRGSATSRFLSNFGQQIDPRHIINAVKHPVDTATNILSAANTNRQMAHEAFDRGETAQGVYRSLGGVPVVGPMMTGIGDQIGEGDYAGAAGTAAGLGVLGAAGKIAPRAVRALPKATGRVQQGVASTVRAAAENPLAAAAGAYEGYQAAGVPGALAGAAGVPLGVRGLRKWIQPAVSHTDDAKWEQEAKNLNARDAFLKKQAAQEARDLSVHERMLDRIKRAETKEQVLAAKEQWQSILQEAKNLNAREKKLAQIAADDAAQARFRELFPDGGERSAPAARVMSSTKKDGIRTTTAQLIRPTGTSAQEELVRLLKQRQTESVGIADAAAEFRQLSRKLVLTPEEAQRLAFLKTRMQTSASEAGLSYPAAQSPQRYVGRDAAGTMRLNPQKALREAQLKALGSGQP